MPTRPRPTPYRNPNARPATPISRGGGNAAFRQLIVGRQSARPAQERLTPREREIRAVEVKPIADEMANNFAKIIQGYGKQQFGTLKQAVNEAYARPRSMREQVSDAFNLQKYAGGLLNFGKEVGKSAVGGIKMTAELGEEGLGRIGVGDGGDLEQIVSAEDYRNWNDLSFWGKVSGITRKNTPVLNMAGQGILDTSGNLMHPSRYKQAVEEGRILDTIIADVGNIALVLGGTGAIARGAAAPIAARAASASTTAGRAALALDAAGARLTSAATLGAQISDAPATIYPFIGKVTGINRLARSDAGQAFRAYLNDKIPVLDPEVRHKRRFMSEQGRGTDAEIFPFVNEYDRKFAGLDPNIEQAVNLYRQNMPYLDDLARRLEAGDITPESASNIIEGFHDWRRPEAKYGEPYNITLESVRLAQKYRDGALPAELTSMMDQLNDFQTRLKEKTTDQALTAGLNPEQLGDQPLTPQVEGMMKKPMARLQKAIDTEDDFRIKLTEAELAAAMIKGKVTTTFQNGKKVVYRSRLTKAENYKLGQAELRVNQLKRALGVAERRRISAEHIARETHAHATTSEPKAMPARFATVARKAEDFRDAVRVEAERLRSQGINADELDLLANEWENMTLPRMRQLGIDPQHLIGGDLELSAAKSRGPSQELLPRRQRIIKERVKEKIAFNTRSQLQMEVHRMMKFGSDRAAVAFARQFGDRIGDILATKFTPDQIASFSPIELDKAIKDMGYMPYSTTQLFAQKSPGSISVDDMAITTKVWEDFVKAPVDPGRFVKFLESANRSWKNTILPFSITWHTGNAIGGMMMAMIGGGVTPVDLVKAGWELKKEMKKAKAAGLPSDMRSVIPHELQGMSLASEIRRFAKLDPSVDVGIPTRVYRAARGIEDGGPSPFRKVVNKLYESNDFVDSFYRSAVYLTKKGKGLSHESAIKNAINALGDYANMSAFERRFIRNVVPFYPWLKHITTLAFRLPIEHPMRVIWTMKLANEFAPPEDENALPWEEGSIEVFGRKFNPTMMFPFADIGTPLNPNEVGQSVSPVLKAIAGVGFGFDIGNMDQVKRPIPEGGTLSDQPSGSMLGDPRAALNYIGSQFSIVNKVRNLLTEPVRRYPTGETRMVQVGDDGNANKVRVRIPHSNADGELVYETVLARDTHGDEIRQADVPMRSASNKRDVALNLLGIPIPQPEQYEFTPQEVTATPNGDGTYSYTWNGKRYNVYRQNGYEYEAPESWARNEEEAQKEKMRNDTMRALLMYRLSRAG